MAKKIKVGILLLLCTLFFYGKTSYAESKELFVETISIPNEVSEYTKNNWKSSLESMLYIDGNIKEDYFLSNGFSLDNSQKNEENTNFLYPILNQEGNIVYLLDVSFNQGDVTSSISSYLADNLNQLASNVEDSPIKFIKKNGRLYYQQNKKIYLFLDNYSPLSVELKEEKPAVTYTEGGDIVSISDSLDSRLGSVNLKNRALQEPEYEADLGIVNEFQIYEHQEEKPWCGAYAIASIVNYHEKKEFTNAEKIMRFSYPNLTYEKLVKSTVSMTLLRDYLNSQNYMSAWSENILSESVVKIHTSLKQPMFLYVEGERGAHALVLLGWLQPPYGYPLMYYIWNPWYQRVMSMPAEEMEKNLSLSGEKYNWTKTLWNINKIKQIEIP